MHYQQQQQQQQQQFYHHFPPYPQQQHPLLAAAASGNNYAFSHPRGFQAAHANGYRTPASGAAGGARGGGGGGGYISGSASGYGGSSSSGYDHRAPPAAHLPTGGSYAYHATAPDTGYGAPPPPAAAPPHPLSHASTDGKKKRKSGGSSALTALTLLAFFFFVNLLQGCLRDQTEAMNPTVMVMTAGVARNKFNKLAEMNSREQQSASPVTSANAFSSGAAIVVRPAHLVASASALNRPTSPPPPLVLQSPYSQSGGHTKPLTNYNYDDGNSNENSNQQHQLHAYKGNDKHNYDASEPEEFYDSNPYSNRTLHSALSSDALDQEHHQQHPHPHPHQSPLSSYQRKPPPSSSHEESRPWSYGSSDSVSSASSSSTASLQRQRGNGGGDGDDHSNWTPTPDERIGGNKYFEDADDGAEYAADRRPDSFHARTN